MKKSTAGKNIPKWQKERLETRHKKAGEYCAQYATGLKTDYDKRVARRDKFAEESGP